MLRAMAAFKDHFSGVAGAYRGFRPHYPDSLIRWLAEAAPRTEVALDVGCGNGQVAVSLAERFARVHAVDPSAEQIRNAVQHARVSYAVAPAEDTGLPARSVDLVVAAQALHWFDLDRFYAELRRVGHEGAVFAAVTYGLTRVNPAVDAVVDHLYRDTLGADWPPERRLVDAGYRTLPFPFPELDVPALEIEERWSLDRFLGYLATWSGVTAYRRRTGADPLTAVEPELRVAWGDPEASVRISWPLGIRAGRIEGSVAARS